MLRNVVLWRYLTEETDVDRAAEKASPGEAIFELRTEY